ncbi:hypothetical protein P7B02_03510 [Caulobacter segnis]|uniref:hypothetical protein n=1 Tax=Caulobacter segnis TaxID=88688 RepID=UPI00240FADC0|nr:hypothetical protein [Caulobacter segnis]MDG2520599.1 hypothetical protein [Caulobacter segnis]
MTFFRLGLAIGLLAATQAHASSPDAWADLRRRSDSACLAQARDLRQARVVAYSPDFRDHTVSSVQGAYRHGAMRGQQARLTCLFDKRTARAEIGELSPRR